MNSLVSISIVVLGFLLPVIAADPNLVANGSFEQSQIKPGAPDYWVAAGNSAVRQQLSIDSGLDGRHCAKLACAEFDGDGPDFHAMLCQVGQVSVRRGQWYQLRFRAKTDQLKAGAVEVALVNMVPWENAGLAEVFPAHSQWQQFDFLFRAQRDLPAATSRLQFWFKGVGALWLDDVALTESDEGQQWFPQIPADGVKNLIPNSSFECGTANWGSYTWGLGGWAGNLYRLEGELDTTVARHGKHCLRIALAPPVLPVFWFDYYEPIRQPVRRVLVANQGWFSVKPGDKLTLSAWLRADAEGVVAQLAAVEAPSRTLRKAVVVGPNWQRHSYTFTASQSFLFIAVGLDLEASERDASTLWIDAVQLERGDHATDYTPRQAMEAFIETDKSGNLFTDPQQGAAIIVRAFNDSDQERTLHGRLAVTDFFDQTVLERETTVSAPAHSGITAILDRLCQEHRGFFRANWLLSNASQSLRFAVIDPIPPQANDSPFGFNHAYPWDFLVRLARQSGIVWWRDWSAKWQTVEPESGRFDFTVPDPQIRRVLALDSEVEVLLPFPSALWSTTARPDDVEKAAGSNSYLRARLPIAFPPRDLADFGRYAAAVARRYRQEQPRPVTTYQILNEPVYTDYALPRKFGYTLDDYLRLLEIAQRALKEADPQCRVVGGISANIEAGLTRDFVTKGGLKLVDVFDLHMYDAARPAETYDEPFQKLEELMRAYDGPKPVWITEWGCYADDDPACLPHTVGDATMNRCRWASERAATEHIVKFAAVAFARGIRKIFFHAGTCGAINSPDAGGVLFEYGGSPRKMLPGVAAFTRLLGVPDECLKTVERDGLRACVFRAKDHVVAVAWRNGDSIKLEDLPASARAFDIMGNELTASRLVLGESPLYFVGQNAADIIEMLSR